jgi:hypothetical protein
MSSQIEKLANRLEKVKLMEDEEEYLNLHLATLLDLDDLMEDDVETVLRSAVARYTKYMTNPNFKKVYLLTRRVEDFLKQYTMHKVSNEMLFQYMKQTDAIILNYISQVESLGPSTIL